MQQLHFHQPFSTFPLSNTSDGSEYGSYDSQSRERGYSPYSGGYGPSDLAQATGVGAMVVHRSGRDLVNMAKKRTNVIPNIEDARHPAKYRMLVGMVDMILCNQIKLELWH